MSEDINRETTPSLIVSGSYADGMKTSAAVAQVQSTEEEPKQRCKAKKYPTGRAYQPLGYRVDPGRGL